MNRHEPINKVMVIILAFFAFLVMSSPSWAATYYVDATSGNDSKDGLSESTAWKTISQVNGHLFSAGDTVYFKRGESWPDEVLKASSGTSGNRVSYDAYGLGDKPLIKTFYADNKEYIDVKNIKFYNNSSGYVVLLYNGTNHIKIDGCTITAGASHNSYYSLWLTDNISYIEVVNSTISHLNTDLQCDAITAQKGINYCRFEGNTVGQATHYSFALEGGFPDSARTGNYNVIKNNTISNSYGAVLSVSTNSNYNLIEDNIISGGFDSGYCNDNPRSFKIIGTGNIVRNNIIKDNPASNASGIHIGVYEYNGYSNVANYNRIYNNTVTAVDKDSIEIGTNGEAGSEAAENIFKNNVVYENGADYSYRQVRTRAHPQIKDNYFINNLWHSTQTSNVIYYEDTTKTVAEVAAYAPTYWQDNLNKAPLLDENYVPQSGSPCLDAGADLTNVASETGSGTIFTVDDPYYFMDGFGIITGDTIKVDATIATIKSIDYNSNTITLTSPISWQNGDPVNLPYNGDKPDIGAFEKESSDLVGLEPPKEPSGLEPPINLQIIN